MGNMKIPKHITLWDKLQQAVIDLTDTDEPIEVKRMTDVQIVDKVIELAYHYRFEYNRLLDEKYD